MKKGRQQQSVIRENTEAVAGVRILKYSDAINGERLPAVREVNEKAKITGNQQKTWRNCLTQARSPDDEFSKGVESTWTASTRTVWS